MMQAATAPRDAAPGSSPVRRVMQVALSLAPGGTERLIIEICRRLRPEFEPLVCCLDDAGAWAPELRSAGIEVIALNRRPGFRPRLGQQIAQLALTHHVDVLHCHQYSPFVYGRIAKLWHPGLRLVYTEHGRLSDAPPSWKRRLVNPALAHSTDAIVAVSDDLREYMVASRLPREQVSVVHNGIDVGGMPAPLERRRARRAMGLGDEEMVFVTVARLDPVKNLDTLLDAFAEVRRAVPGARLVVIGDGPARESLIVRASRDDLAGAVTFLGMRADARSLVAGADVYVNSSVFEGVSITILEAMAAGVPVVATKVGGTPEVLAHGDAGVLVPARNPQRLADAAIRLSRDAVARARLAAAGRRRVESSFTVQRMMAEYMALYRGQDR